MITGFVGLAVFITSLFMLMNARGTRKSPTKYILTAVGIVFFFVACSLMVLGFDEDLRAVIELGGSV